MVECGILGGTFDPIHYGHLFCAERVREEFNLECVYFIPSGNPPHKHYKEMASALHRYRMVELAVKSNPYFKVLDIELKREGYSYTIDTINQLHELFRGKVKFYFIIGADNITDIPNWKNSEELIKKLEFIAVTRPGKWKDEFELGIKMLENKGCKINVISIPLIFISSTEIRERIKANKTIKYMVPEEVEKYIIDNKLYV